MVRMGAMQYLSSSMDWSLLQSFLEVSAHGSLSAASRALRVSQPTLSRRLVQLEEALSVSLFLRGPRGLTLTAAGERLLAIAERMRQAAGAVPDVARAGHDPVSGVVRVSAPDVGLIADWLPTLLLPLRALHPGLLVELAIENRVVEMAKREADIALRNQRPRDGALTARAAGTYPWFLYGARDYIAARPRVAELAHLRQHDVLLYETAGDSRQTKWLARHRLLDRVVLRSNGIDALARAARVGWGVALLPSFVADRDPALERLLPEQPIIRTPLWLVTHVELQRSPRVSAVFRYLARSLEGDRERPPR
jgi:DNA-binding transcriptional LysR family regulator